MGRLYDQMKRDLELRNFSPHTRRTYLACVRRLEVLKETWQDLLTRITGIDPRVCPYCGKGKMTQRETLPPCSIGLADNLLPHPGCSP